MVTRTLAFATVIGLAGCPYSIDLAALDGGSTSVSGTSSGSSASSGSGSGGSTGSDSSSSSGSNGSSSGSSSGQACWQSTSGDCCGNGWAQNVPACSKVSFSGAYSDNLYVAVNPDNENADIYQVPTRGSPTPTAVFTGSTGFIATGLISTGTTAGFFLTGDGSLALTNGQSITPLAFFNSDSSALAIGFVPPSTCAIYDQENGGTLGGYANPGSGSWGANLWSSSNTGTAAQSGQALPVLQQIAAVGNGLIAASNAGLAVYDSQGDLCYTSTCIQTSGQGPNIFTGVAIDPAGTAYLIGQDTGSNGVIAAYGPSDGGSIPCLWADVGTANASPGEVPGCSANYVPALAAMHLSQAAFVQGNLYVVTPPSQVPSVVYTYNHATGSLMQYLAGNDTPYSAIAPGP